MRNFISKHLMRGRNLFITVLPELSVVSLAIPFGFVSGLGSWAMVKLSLLLIGQNVSFTIVSRARQMASLRYHAAAAVGSNGFYIFVITTVVAHYNNFWLKIWYIACTVVGSVHAHHLSLTRIEKSKRFEKSAMISKADLDHALKDLEERLRGEMVVLQSRQPLTAS